MLISFSDSWNESRLMNAAKQDFRSGFSKLRAGVCSSYIPNQLVDLVPTDVVHCHHSVEGSVTYRCVAVSDVHSNLLQRFGRSRLADIHPITLYEATQFL